ncbi:nucleotide exchange factor GrpE [Nocardioides sp. TRM66260-LWL]|uniref:nucleotide exchange factor GrpE n=1 Tax=Nocardioides sp. TRM66260-LWL TaxID=2874478 RepID=UPI001CC4AAAC|nr:nucleotide exchange factor GrpE [Nocardioides sp. TRM66260-LWL]MBZ5735389.1 nucleotide exchange factor GrpE [Nocardioides sp. TRM66260-LWL]
MTHDEAGREPDAGTPGAADAVAPEAAAGADGVAPAPGEDVDLEAAGAHEGAPDGSAPESADDPLARAEAALAERTGDLQRLQAEFLNYKRRVERDRDLIRENATYAALTPIIEVLDTIDRAKEHEPLEGGFKAVAEQLERTVAGLGLIRFGEPGDAFDPELHEALSHIGSDAEVTVTTCKVIAKAGYRIGDRVVRAAQVLVVEPA